jgi:hypothetical protein
MTTAATASARQKIMTMPIPMPWAIPARERVGTWPWLVRRGRGHQMRVIP